MRLGAEAQARAWHSCWHLAAVLITLMVCALLVAWAGARSAAPMRCSSKAPFGSPFALSGRSPGHPLVLTGLAAAVAFQAGFTISAPRGGSMSARFAAVAVGAQGRQPRAHYHRRCASC